MCRARSVAAIEARTAPALHQRQPLARGVANGWFGVVSYWASPGTERTNRVERTLEGYPLHTKEIRELIHQRPEFAARATCTEDSSDRGLEPILPRPQWPR